MRDPLRAETYDSIVISEFTQLYKNGKLPKGITMCTLMDFVMRHKLGAIDSIPPEPISVVGKYWIRNYTIDNLFLTAVVDTSLNVSLIYNAEFTDWIIDGNWAYEEIGVGVTRLGKEPSFYEIPVLIADPLQKNHQKEVLNYFYLGNALYKPLLNSPASLSDVQSFLDSSNVNLDRQSTAILGQFTQENAEVNFIENVGYFIFWYGNGGLKVYVLPLRYRDIVHNDASLFDSRKYCK